MASSSQRRCVFVGNIPYDATEEQLIEICREVGPVVSFRLVIDRETGKPKGYGFCEYKDEETALSARRNLQGYEINGRQLRVDFAENDKGGDRSREQTHGGPGLAVGPETQKQVGGSGVHGEGSNNQPIGLHLAITAATYMAGALGGPQIGSQSAQIIGQSQSAPTSDPLTLHLAKMSRNQLKDIISSLKVMATQNKEQARELLLTRPLLLKAIFQVQLMLGMVNSEVLQMPNLLQPPGSLARLQHNQLAHQLATQNVPGIAIASQKSLNQEIHVPQSLLIQKQFPHIAQQSRAQHPQAMDNVMPTQPALLHQSEGPKFPADPRIRSQFQLPNPSLSQQEQPSLSRHPGPVTISRNINYGDQMSLSTTSIRSSRAAMPDVNLQLGRPLSSGFTEQRGKRRDYSEPISRESKIMKLEDGRGRSFHEPASAMTHGSVSAHANLPLRAEQDVESTLLQQVRNLTPEQLNSLAPEQRQQVLRLQQILKQDQMQT